MKQPQRVFGGHSHDPDSAPEDRRSSGEAEPLLGPLFRRHPWYVTEFKRISKQTSLLRAVSRALLPWFVFVIANLIVTFLFHPAKVLLLAVYFLCIFFMLVAAALSLRGGGTDRAYSIAVCGMALITGALAGYYNYCVNTYSYWRFAEGREYLNVLPDELAAAHMDASLLSFAAGVEPNVKFAMSYGSGSGTYCVAPIMMETAAAASVADAGVQFWAVGRDCCSASGFNCDSVGASSAHYGMVVFNRTDIFTPLLGSDIRLYTQAVGMANARFGLKSATRPIFVRWVSNTVLARAVYVGRAWLTWLKAILITFPLWVLISLLAPTFDAAPEKVDRRAMGSRTSAGMA